MWHVLLWLNIYSITVVCQRGYIPHHSFFIESLLYPQKDLDVQEVESGPAPLYNTYLQPRYKNSYLNSSYRYGRPYTQYCGFPKKIREPVPQSCSNGFSPSRKSRKSKIQLRPISKPHTPETYVLFKNVPPILIGSKYKPHFSPRVTTVKDSLLFGSSKNKYDLYETGKNFIKLDQVLEEGRTQKNKIFPIGAKSVNLILPSPIIINSLGVWPSRATSTTAVSDNVTTVLYDLDGHVENQPTSPQCAIFNTTEADIQKNNFSKKYILNIETTTGALRNEIFNKLESLLSKRRNNTFVKLATQRSKEYMIPKDESSSKKFHCKIKSKNWVERRTDDDLAGIYLSAENVTLYTTLRTPSTESEDEEIMGLIQSINALYQGFHMKKSTIPTTTRDTKEVLFEEDIDDLCYNAEDQGKTDSLVNEEFYGEDTGESCITNLEKLNDEEISLKEGNALSRNKENDIESTFNEDSYSTNNEEYNCMNKSKICVSCHPHHKYVLELSQRKNPVYNLHRKNKNFVRSKRKTSPWEIYRRRRKMKREYISSEGGSTTEESKQERRVYRGPYGRVRRIPVTRWNVLKKAGNILVDDQGRAIEIIDDGDPSIYLPKINRKRAFVSSAEGPRIISKNRASLPSVDSPITEETKRKTMHEKVHESKMGKAVVIGEGMEVHPKTRRPSRPKTVVAGDGTTMAAGEGTTDRTTLMVPDTGNRHPSKLACEEATHMECICCIESAIADLNNMAAGGRDVAVVTDGVVAYECSDYRPLNASYLLSSNLKPRLITKKSKQLIVDDKAGPKEVMKDTFIDLLYRGIPNEGIDFYIFPSTSVKIPCFTSDDIQLSPNTADLAVYQWRHGDDRPITEGRAVEDANHKGQLEISDAIGTDSDTYKCTVTYRNPDTEEVVTNTFIHSLFVVQLPKIVLQTPLHYRARVKCDQETLEMFELYLPQQVEELVCYCHNDTRRACVVEIHNPLCQGKTYKVKKRKNPKRIWHFDKSRAFYDNETSEELSSKMEMSMDYQVALADVSDVIDAAVNKTHCNPFCQLKMLLKLVDIIRDSLVISLSHPVSASTGVSFQPDVDTLDVKMLIGCEGGLQLYQGFCIPCPVNTYSEEGSTECTPCPPGSHQPHIGSKRCERCVTPFQSGCSASWGTPLWLFLGILMIFLLGVIAFLLIKRMLRKKTRKEKKNYLATDSTRSTRSSTYKRVKPKRQKSVHYSDTSEDLPPPSLPSEDFTG